MGDKQALPAVPGVLMSDPAKGLEFANDLAKQIIAVATGTLAFTVTFAEKFDPDGKLPPDIPMALKIAWIAYIFAIVGSIWLMMAAAGSANSLQTNPNAGNIMNNNTKWPACLMIVAFIAGLGFTVGAGWVISG